MRINKNVKTWYTSYTSPAHCKVLGRWQEVSVWPVLFTLTETQKTCQKHKRYWQEHTRYWEVSGIFDVFCWTCHQYLSGFLQLGHLSSVLNDGSLNHAVDQVHIVKLLQWQCSSRPASSWFSFSVVCVMSSLQQPIAVPCRITSLDLGNVHLPLLPLSPQYDHPGQQGFKKISFLSLPLAPSPPPPLPLDFK